MHEAKHGADSLRSPAASSCGRGDVFLSGALSAYSYNRTPQACREMRRGMLLALALVRTASAYLLSGTSCRAWRTAARMTATVDAAWDIGTDIEGAEGAAACHAVFAELAASPAFASETWARRPLLLSSPSADFAGAFTMDDVEVAVESDFLDAGTPLLLNRLPTPWGSACPPHAAPPAHPRAPKPACPTRARPRRLRRRRRLADGASQHAARPVLRRGEDALLRRATRAPERHRGLQLRRQPTCPGLQPHVNQAAGLRTPRLQPCAL